METNEYTYNSKPTKLLTKDELEECHKLYNENYGNYRADYSKKPGGQVIFSIERYMKYVQDDFYIAMAKCNGVLVAHAFYIRKRYPDYGIMTWVLQLVVHRNYRQQGIAGKLLHSIWGFSDDFAWGLATANPCTVKTLESATYRRCNPELILKNIEAVKLIGKDTTFIDEEAYEIDENSSCVNTKFFVDNSSYSDIESMEQHLGVLKRGYEWLAVTFRSQKPVEEMYERHFKELIEFSENKLKEAYARMDVNNHSWAKKTAQEVDFICKYIKGRTVLDMGCGHGRHSIELGSRGYDVTAIDYVKSNIQDAQKKCDENNIKNVQFFVDDLRGARLGTKYDAVICLYDVVGSFPDDKDNLKLLQTAYSNLNDEGIFVLSVMNMELTRSIVPVENVLEVKKNPEALFKLKSSDNMQNSGDIFDGECMLIDSETGIVYRKEQFDNNNELSAEYIIRDKRYTMNEIKNELERIGFSIVDSFYTRAGFSDYYQATDKHAKEILVVARK